MLSLPVPKNDISGEIASGNLQTKFVMKLHQEVVRLKLPQVIFQRKFVLKLHKKRKKKELMVKLHQGITEEICDEITLRSQKNLFRNLIKVICPKASNLSLRSSRVGD